MEENLSASAKQEAVIQTKSGNNEDAILPVGWTGEGDFFEPDTWSGSTESVDASKAVTTKSGNDGEQIGAEAIANLITNELNANAEATESGDEAEAETTTPADENGTNLKFKAQLDHKDVDVELSKEDLPAVWQKAQIVDRVQEKLKKTSEAMSRMNKLAKYLEYDGIDDFYKGTVDNLIAQEKDDLLRQGVTETIADDYARRKISDLIKDIPEIVEPEEKKPEEPGKRDFTAELKDFWEAYPDQYGKQLPDEVVKLAGGPNGKSIVRAYEIVAMQKLKAELDTLRKENKKLKQNEDAAKRAPVRGVTNGGATNKDPDDPFLAGFNFES